MTPEQAQVKFVAWQEAVQRLKEVKSEEGALRKELGAFYFPTASTEGSNVLRLEGGWKLEFTTKVSRSLENKKGETDAVVAQLPPEVRDATVSFKPSLKMKGYKDLSAEHRALLDTVITSKPGAPTLKLVPPKGA